MRVEDKIREIVGERGKKYHFVITVGAEAPKAIHRDGVTHWKNGRPRSYDRAINEINVGWQWINVGWQWIVGKFPASVMAWKLSGVKNCYALDILNDEVAGQQWLLERAEMAAESAAVWAFRKCYVSREADRADSDGRRRA